MPPTEPFSIPACLALLTKLEEEGWPGTVIKSASLAVMRDLCGVIAGCRDCDGIGVTYTIMSHTGGTTRVTSHCPHCTPLRAIVEKWYGEAVKLP